MMDTKKGKVETALGNSFINYFSDLFIVCMVLGWILVLVIMVLAALYATIILNDTSVWSYVENLVAIPLSAGGAIWMIKNSVQHAIANNKGERARMDFPRVPDTEVEVETEMKNGIEEAKG